MQGKHLTQKERFYIEKRRGKGINQATIARELNMSCSTILGLHQEGAFHPHLA
ncbi:helix-turn-helix domain-containing protein [Candidatus Erwinia dacicola]